MESPLHPAVVHLPLGLCMVMPIVAAVAAWSLRRPEPTRTARLWVAGGQVLIVQGGLLALRTGEDDEEIVERVVRGVPLEAHEAAGQTFVIAAGIVLLLALVSVVLRAGRPGRWLAVATLLGTLAVAGLGLRAGQTGGALVYEHGAAAAHAPNAPAGKPAGEHERDH